MQNCARGYHASYGAPIGDDYQARFEPDTIPIRLNITKTKMNRRDFDRRYFETAVRNCRQTNSGMSGAVRKTMHYTTYVRTCKKCVTRYPDIKSEIRNVSMPVLNCRGIIRWGGTAVILHLIYPIEAAISIQLDNFELLCADAGHGDGSILPHYSCVDKVRVISQSVVLSIVSV